MRDPRLSVKKRKTKKKTMMKNKCLVVLFGKIVLMTKMRAKMKLTLMMRTLTTMMLTTVTAMQS